MTAFVNFPSSYTQSTVERAFRKYLPEVSITTDKPSDRVQIQYADYDLIEFDWLMQDSDNSIGSSYCFRKALTRKNYLHQTIEAYLAKIEHRLSVNAVDTSEKANVELLRKAMPKCWTIDVAHSEDLDEVLMDELYDLNQAMNDESDSWFILKPAMADRANGIRLFNSEETLREIFEEFDSDSEDEDEGEEDEESTAVSTSQLRHFVIQEYISNPLLIDPTGGKNTFNKFHLRVYVLCVGSIKVYMPTSILALFASQSYKQPDEDQSLLSHLTNSCLQGSNMDRNTFVKSLEELEGCYTATGEQITPQQIEGWLDSASKVIGQAVKGAVESGSVHFQPIPNAFEIYGVDLLVTETNEVKLLEFNGCPDFGQTGDRLAWIVDNVVDASFEKGILELLGKNNISNTVKTIKCLDYEFKRGW
ncbi:TTL-domain-containing protein [Wallemia mellicola]|uniref:TTL-domain-containing protein n=1 Tax=Wallemia mellicola TaxID=1708541 RepID=A0A4T0M3B5_9BASI|nr:TTL-domain-containing protein [Wallemia mellicola]TIB97995.1 TTL-domain-containing protein [Wallemia mellicola]TIC10831.1 TTL-domain-containing protein [Wallemia mellicola]TIC52248.1 TTL-domain-containing protein [Wallemia mellicola]